MSLCCVGRPCGRTITPCSFSFPAACPFAGLLCRIVQPSPPVAADSCCRRRLRSYGRRATALPYLLGWPLSGARPIGGEGGGWAASQQVAAGCAKPKCLHARDVWPVGRAGRPWRRAWGGGSRRVAEFSSRRGELFEVWSVSWSCVRAVRLSLSVAAPPLLACLSTRVTGVVNDIRSICIFNPLMLASLCRVFV